MSTQKNRKQQSSRKAREELKSEIIETAYTLLKQEGGDELNIRKIAGKISCAQGTIYNIFENRDDILLHVFARAFAEMEQVFALVPVSGVPEADLKNYLKTYKLQIDENLNLWQFILDYHFPTETDFPSWYLAAVSAMLSYIEKALHPIFLLASSKQSDQQAQINALTEQTARILWAGMQGLMLLDRNDKLRRVGAKNSDETMFLMLEYLLLGIRSKYNVREQL